MERAAVGQWWWRISRWGLVLVLLAATGSPVPAAFEVTGGSARGYGLGRALGASPGAAEGVWYNPAGSARVPRLTTSLTHGRLFPGLNDDISLSVLSIAVPMMGGGLQAGLSSLGSEDWQELVVALGYARPVNRRADVGATVRSEGWETIGLSHRSWSLDVGAVYEVGWVLPQVHLQLSAVASLAPPNLAAGGQGGRKARRGALGARFDFGQQVLLVEVERQGGATELRAGYEATAPQPGSPCLRLGARGFSVDWQVAELDAGFGCRWRQWQFDYAYLHPLEPSSLNGSHWITLGYRPE